MATLLPLQSFTGSNGSALPSGSNSGFINGAIPTGGSATIQSNAAQLITGTTGGYAGASRVSQVANLSTAPANAVWKSKIRLSADEVYPQCYVRGGGSTLDTQFGYRVALDHVGDTWEVATVSAYNQVPIVTATPFSWVTNADYWIIFGAVGTDLRFKVWKDGAPEPNYAAVGSPTSQTLSLTDSSVTAAGLLGMTVAVGNLGNGVFTFDEVEIFDAFPPTPPVMSQAMTRPSGAALVRAGSW